MTYDDADSAYEQNKRESFIKGLRDLADFLESHPALPSAAWTVYATAYVPDAKTAREMRKGTGGWVKTLGQSYPSIEYTRPFGLRSGFGWENETRLDRATVQYVINVPPAETCKRVKTGTKVVKAVPEHEEDVYEWKCGPARKNGAGS